jgi:hypothetical protein
MNTCLPRSLRISAQKLSGSTFVNSKRGAIMEQEWRIIGWQLQSLAISAWYVLLTKNTPVTHIS